MKTMKYLSMLLIMVAMSVCMTSCGDDDDEPVKGNSSLVGTWESQGFVYGGYECTLRVEFKSNNKGTMSLIYDDISKKPDHGNFEYIKREDSEGKTYLKIIWESPVYEQTMGGLYVANKEYEISVTPTWLIWERKTYVRK